MFVALAVLSLIPTVQRPRDEGPDLTLDAATRTTVIETLARELDGNYVFPDVGKAMNAKVRARLAAKGYDSITSARAFAEELTKDLQSVSRDKHMRVRYRSEAIPQRPPRAAQPEQPSPEEMEEFRREEARNNFGFFKVERLEGNIGYVDMRAFVPADIAREKATAVMAFVADTDALIFDLRKNGGGSPDQIAWLCSYLFEGRVHLNDIYMRPEDRTEEFWTNPGVPGTKYLDKPVYVLTSDYTFSGAEEFAYNLKTQKRALIVGETTGGGANPGGMARLHEHFAAFIPMGRAINPITKTNWEGTGVEPDVKIEEDRALAKACVLALEHLVAEQPRVLPIERAEALAGRRKELEATPRPVEAREER